MKDDMGLIIKDLLVCFPRGIVNHNFEFVADPRPQVNSYFMLSDCKTIEDVNCKILMWFSRMAYKAMPFRANHLNDEVHSYHLRGINEFLGTDFTTEDVETIYTYIGGGCNKNLTRIFVRSNYNICLLLDPEVRKTAARGDIK